MAMSLAEMQAEYKTKTDYVEGVFAAEPDDAKIPAAVKQEIITANKRREELEVEIKNLSETAGLRSQHAEQKAWQNLSAGNMRHSGNPVSGEILSGDAANAAFRANETVADTFLSADAFKAWHADTHHGGMPTSKGTHLQSPAITMPNLSLKTLITSGGTDVGRYTNTSGGAVVRPQYLDMVALPFRPLKLREVVTVIEATSPFIE
jgi:hypothetical protein